MKPKLSIFFIGLFVMVGLGSLSPLIFKDYQSGKIGQLPVVGKAPVFSIIDSHGKQFTSSQLEDKVWLFNVFFSSCHGPCPKMGAHLGLIHREFKDEPALQIVSLSVDPENDTPQVLTSYAEKLGADTSKWHFVRDEPQGIKEIAYDGFHIAVSDDGPMGHGSHFALVDRRGMIRGYYSGTERAEVDRLKTDIKKLL